MTFKEAIEFSLTVPWKTIECNSGSNCWCRVVVPVDPIWVEFVRTDGSIYEDTLDEIIGSEAIDEKTAQYIVDLHNKSVDLNRNHKKTLQALQHLSDLDQELGLQ